MLKQNKTLSFSERHNKNQKFKKYMISNEAISPLKDSKKIILFDNIKLKEKSNNIYTKKYINNIKNNEIFGKRKYHKIFREDKNQRIRKIILAKKYLLKEILYDECKNELKEKNNHKKINNFNSFNSISNKNKDIILINNISTPESEIKNNREIFGNEKKENYENAFNLKDFENGDKKILREKLDKIRMNKLMLFNKIKYEGLKKFCCKDIKHYYNKKFRVMNLQKNIENKNKQKLIKNELFEYFDNLNNCSEIAINSIKEKVRNYFKGKFENIKEYFDDWDENGIGKISINDIYKYLNIKIKYKISKDEIKRLMKIYFKKNYLDLQNFKYFFIEEPSNKKLTFHKIFFDKKENLFKSLSDGDLFNENEDKNLHYKNCKYKQLMSLIIEQKDKILNEENQKEELDYNDFYNLIIKIIKENKKQNFDNEIKKIFLDYKLKNSEIINKADLIDKIKSKININNLSDINKIELPNAKIINLKYSTFYGKFKNNTNFKKNIYFPKYKKDSILSKTNYYLFKINKSRNIEENNCYQSKNLKNKIKEYNSQNLQLNNSNTLKEIKEIIFKDRLSMTHENIGNSDFNIPKLRKYQLPKISTKTRIRNKNSDIINLL